MPSRTPSLTVPLPRGWTKIVRSATLHAISVAVTALTTAWGRAATSRSARLRQRGEVDRLRTEIALLKEELEIKDARWGRVPARRRPHYGPVQRMRILELRAARGWSTAQAARHFLVTEDTIASWIRRVDEGGERALVRIEEPVNRFPDFVRYLVRSLKLMCPRLRKILESYGITWDPQGARGSEIKLTGKGKRMRIGDYRKYPQQLIRNIRQKFHLRPKDGVSDEEFYDRG